MSLLHVNMPRDLRVEAAKLADQIAKKGHGLSAEAETAVEALLSDSDLVFLTYLQGAVLMSQVYAASALRASWEHQPKHTHRMHLAIGMLQRQLGPQMTPTIQR